MSKYSYHSIYAYAGLNKEIPQGDMEWFIGCQ